MPANPPHTAQHTPWHLETYLAFSDRLQAHASERYLKTGSGIAFANKRLRNLHRL
jgi:putative endonuclease